MSIWTSDSTRIRSALLILSIVGLSACGGGRFPTSTPTKTSSKSTISVSGQDVIIAGPPGFCMDETVSQMGVDTAFVVLGNCAIVKPGGRGQQPKIKALLTASVSGSSQYGAPLTTTADSLDQFFRSETGRTALSRVSDPTSVTILDSFENGGAYYLRASDTSPGVVPDASHDYWRAYFDLKGQLVSVSVIGFTSSPLAPATGLDTVREFTRTMRLANGDTTEIPPPEDPGPTTTTQPDYTTEPANDRPKPKLRGVGLLRRLFG